MYQASDCALAQEFTLFLFNRTIIVFDQEDFISIARQFNCPIELCEQLVDMLIKQNFLEKEERWHILNCPKVKKKYLQPYLDSL